jgi:hypothetical protein
MHNVEEKMLKTIDMTRSLRKRKAKCSNLSQHKILDGHDDNQKACQKLC